MKEKLNLSELKKMLGSGEMTNKDFETLIKVFSKQGETKRLSSLSPQEKQFYFDLLVTNKVYFDNTGIEDYKPMIPDVVEIGLDLNVSETQNKDKNLLQTIAEVMQTKLYLKQNGGDDGK